MNLFQPTYSVGDMLAGHASATLHGNRKSEREQAKLSRRAFDASRAFPNNNGGYVRREKKPADATPLTPAERFARLQATFLAGPMPGGTHFRKPTRGRSRRRKIVGVRVGGIVYGFNEPRIADREIEKATPTAADPIFDRFGTRRSACSIQPQTAGTC